MSPVLDALSPGELRALAAEGAAEAVRSMARLTGGEPRLEEGLVLHRPARTALVRLGGPGPELVAVGMDLVEPLGGAIVLLVDAAEAERLASALVPGAAAGSLDAEGESALLELANIAGSAFVSALARGTRTALVHGVPRMARGRAGSCLDELAGGASGPAFAARMRWADGAGMLLLLPDPQRMAAFAEALERA